MQSDFSLKAWRAEFRAPSGDVVAVDNYRARNLGQAVAFARSRAPVAAAVVHVSPGFVA